MMSDKYTHFRNYMCNELAITKDDIMEWTKEAVTATVLKQIGQINVAGIVRDHVRSKVYTTQTDVIRETAKELAKRCRLIDTGATDE